MFILNKKAAIVILLLFTYLINAQNTFSKKIHYGVLDNLATYVSLYNDTFYIPVMVSTQSQPSTHYSASLLKIDINGNVLPKTFYTQINTSIFPTDCYYKSSTDKFYVCATISHGSDVKSALVIFNKNGDTLAIKSFGDTAYYNYMEWILPQTNNHNKLLIFGTSDSLCGSGHTGPYCHPIIRVTDTLGNLLYTKSYMTGGLQRQITNVDTTEDKGYIFSGFEQQSSSGNGQSYVIKLDSNLNMVWQNYYYNCGTIFPSIQTLKSGGYIHGYASLDSVFQGFAYYSKIALAKIDKNGNVLWNKEYGTLQRDVDASSVKELPNGDLIVCGVTDVPTGLTGSNNIQSQQCGYLLRTDSMGNEKWMQTYKITNPTDLGGQNYLNHVITMPDGGFTAVGYVGTTDTATQLTWILRVDSNGCLTPGCTPMSTGINQLETNSGQFTAYPNPFNNELTVSVIFPENTQDAKLQLIEPATGRILMEKTLTDKQQAVVFDTKELSSGLYLIGIKSANNKAQFIKVITFK